MKLTNYIRDAYINAVMDDVPKIDYDEQLRALVVKTVVAAAPKAVQAAWEDPASQPFVNIRCHWYGDMTVYAPDTRHGDFKLTEEQEKPIKELVAQRKTQQEKLNNIRVKVRSAAYGCTTRKALADLLPEFVQYLPSEYECTTKNVPVIANLMADIVQAGWPKDKKKPAAITA